MFEYKEMAKYYDLFYYSKSYEKEIKFLENLIGNRKSILDDRNSYEFAGRKRLSCRWIRLKY